jgi:signal peptidase II
LSDAAPRAVDIRVGSTPDGLAPIAVAERSLAPGLSQWFGLGVVALCALAADQFTKWLLVDRVELGESVKIVGPLSLTHVGNSGIAFGLFPESAVVITVLTAALVTWMLFFFARSGALHPVLPAALGFVIGGSASNLLDRVRIGYVTDFVDFGFWPAFNLADSFIVTGVAVLVAMLLLPDRRVARIERDASSPSRS